MAARPAHGLHGDSPAIASSQQFHEIAPAAEALLEGCDISRLLERERADGPCGR